MFMQAWPAAIKAENPESTPNGCQTWPTKQWPSCQAVIGNIREYRCSIPYSQPAKEDEMGDHVVVLRSDDPLAFVADACAALADLVNETRPVAIQATKS